MLTGTVRARLVESPTIGAGNFLHHLRTVRSGDDFALWSDPDFRTPDGRATSRFTLNELNALVETYAGWYHAHGVRPRDPVAVHTGSAMETVVNYLALTSLGAVPALVNKALPARTAAAYVSRLGAVAAFVDDRHASALRDLESTAPATVAGPRTLRFLGTRAQIGPEYRAELPSSYPYEHAPADPVLITHSSGTTGVPKAVGVDHAGFFAPTRHHLRRTLPRSWERVVSALPATHNSGITMVMIALLAGLPIRVLSDRSARSVLDAIEDFRPTMVAAFSGTYAELAATDLDRRDLSSVGLWYNSGDAAHRAHIRTLIRHGRHVEVTPEGRRSVPGSGFHDGLGSSEMGHSLFYLIHYPGAELPPRCVGKPHTFVEAAVLSPGGDPLPPGQIGRLGVKSPSVTPGYWNDSVTTYRSWLRGYWLTGDLVYRDEQGRFYHVDRITDAIRTRDGDLYSVWAEEVLLDACAELADCTIVGVDSNRTDDRRPDGPDRQHPPAGPGHVIDAYALLQTRPDAPRDIDWTAKVNEVLHRHGMPSVTTATVLDADDLPLGPTGKVRKRELRARFERTDREAP